MLLSLRVSSTILNADASYALRKDLMGIRNASTSVHYYPASLNYFPAQCKSFCALYLKAANDTISRSEISNRRVAKEMFFVRECWLGEKETSSAGAIWTVYRSPGLVGNRIAARLLIMACKIEYQVIAKAFS